MSSHAKKRDFTLSCYHNSLWVREIHELEGCKGKFPLKLKNGKIVQIQFVTLFGTIVELKHINETCKIYTVDDGTGLINCKHNVEAKDTDELEDWDWKDLTCNATVNEVSSMCDTVFNDRTVQQEEQEAHKKAQFKALESLRWSVLNSFRSSEQLQVGETVCVHGRLYSYFHDNQIYVNAIRLISMDEELALMTAKLEDSQDSLHVSTQIAESSDADTQVNEANVSHVTKKLKTESSEGGSTFLEPLVPVATTGSSTSRRPSGLMTFDTVEESGAAARKAVSVPSTFSQALPASPQVVPGALSVAPSTSEMPASFDTFQCHVEPSETSSDEDLFIPPTPKSTKKQN